MAKCNAVAGFNALNGVELNLFTTDELKAIHYATMEVLMNPGVQVSDPPRQGRSSRKMAVKLMKRPML